MKTATPAFMSVFMEAVSEQYRWAAAIDFKTAVMNVLLEENREPVMDLFVGKHGYLPSAVTTERLKLCYTEIFPEPIVFSVGDKVMYIGTDITDLMDGSELIVTDVSPGADPSDWSYALGGFAWIPRGDLAFLKSADADSIEQAWFLNQNEETDDDTDPI